MKCSNQACQQTETIQSIICDGVVTSVAGLPARHLTDTLLLSAANKALMGLDQLDSTASIDRSLPDNFRLQEFIVIFRFHSNISSNQMNRILDQFRLLINHFGSLLGHDISSRLTAAEADG